MAVLTQIGNMSVYY